MTTFEELYPEELFNFDQISRGGKTPPDTERFSHFQTDGRVAAFPKKRFLEFLSVLRVQSKDYGVVAFELLGSQRYLMEEMIEAISRGVTTFLVLKARQLGISTFLLALDLFWAFEYQGILGAFVTHDEGSREQFRNQIDIYLKTLPNSHIVKDDIHNRMMLVLENNSLFRYLVAGGRSTTNKLGRSGGSNYCHSTETAFYGSADDVKALMQTFSETYKHRLYIFESTANGFNFYYDMCETAKASPAQKLIFIGWWRDERNEFHAKHPLYREYMPESTQTPVTALEKRKIREVKELYDFDINAGQMAWYRFHLETKCNGDQNMMDQEMPWTEEDAFRSTGSVFFANETITKEMREAKNTLCMPFIVRLTDDFMDTVLLSCKVEKADLKIYESPKAGAKYVVGADPIYGSSDNRDNGIISVFRCYADKMVQVAEFVSSHTSAFQFAWTLAYICGLYGDVFLILEMNGPGTAVYGEMVQLRQKLATTAPGENEDIRNCLLHMKNFLYRRADSLSSNALLQWITSPSNRGALLHKFHIGVESGRAKIRSIYCLEECRHLIIEPGGYIGAPPSKKDDRIFGAALAYWAWDMSIRPGLAARGLTVARTEEIEQGGGINPVTGMVERFLKHQNIAVGQ